jgi:hypothetical protein
VGTTAVGSHGSNRYAAKARLTRSRVTSRESLLAGPPGTATIRAVLRLRVAMRVTIQYCVS